MKSSKAVTRRERGSQTSFLRINPGWISDCCDKKTIKASEKSANICIHFSFSGTASAIPASVTGCLLASGRVGSSLSLRWLLTYPSQSAFSFAYLLTLVSQPGASLLTYCAFNVSCCSSFPTLDTMPGLCRTPLFLYSIPLSLSAPPC